MMGVFSRLRAAIDEIRGKNRIDKFDFGVLQTMMMLAAVDGEVSDEELAAFRKMASECDGYSPESFTPLFRATLRSAGYLLLLSRVLPRDELVAAFVEEAEGPFIVKVSRETAEVRGYAVSCLERMAKADGVFSEIERACIDALARRVEEAYEATTAALCSAAAYYCSPTPRL